MESKFLSMLLTQITLAFDGIYEAYDGNFEKIASEIYRESTAEFDEFIEGLAKSSKYGMVFKEDSKELSNDELVSRLIESTGSVRNAITAVLKNLKV